MGPTVHVRWWVAVVLLAATAALMQPHAAAGVTVTLLDEKFASPISGRPGWSTGTYRTPSHPIFSGAAPEVVFPGSPSRYMSDGNAGSLWIAQDAFGSEDPYSVYDNLDAYYDIKVRVVAKTGTGPSAKADIDAVQSLRGGTRTRLESDQPTSAVTRSSSPPWSSEAGARYSGGTTLLAETAGAWAEFVFSGDASLEGPNNYNPRRRISIIVGRRGSGRSGLDFYLYTRPPGGSNWSALQSGSIDESRRLYQETEYSQSRYPADMDGWARYALDLRNYDSARVTYWWYKPYSVTDVGGDSAYVQVVSQATGQVINTIQSIQPNMWWSRWYQVSSTLGPAQGAGQQVWLQFRATSDQDKAGEGVYFDDVLVTASTPPPQAPSVASPSHPEQNVYYANDAPEFTWSDPPSTTVAGYSYSIDGSPGTEPVPSANLPGSQHSLTVPGQPSGTRYFHLRAIDGAGQAGDTAHRRAMIDVQKPSEPIVDDGVSGWSSQSTRTLRWSPASDYGLSGVANYQYRVGSGSWTTVGSAITTAPVGPLPEGSTTLEVRAVDAVGNVGAAGSHVAQYDGSAPTTPSVFDAGDFTPQTTRLTANWSCFDAYSGIDRFEYAIGTTPGGTQTRSWTNVGAVTSVTATGLSLTYDVTYFVSVRAFDKVGHMSAVGSADGITPKVSELAAPTVTDDGTSTADGTRLHVSWSPVAGAQAYRVSAGSEPGWTDLASWSADVAPATQTTLTGLSVPDGTIAYLNVQAKSVFGNWGQTGFSDGLLVDGSPPPAASPSFEGTVTRRTTEVSFAPGVDDPHSRLSAVRYALGTSGPGSTNLTGGWRTVTPADPILADGIAMSTGDLVYVSVKGINRLGAEGDPGFAGPLLVDALAPEAITLVWPTDGEWISNTQPVMRWQAVTDAHSGVVRLELEVAGELNELGADATSGTPANALADGDHLWTLHAIDAAGNTATARPRTVRVDTTPPSTPTVTMNAATATASALGASWSSADEQSGIDHFSYAVADAPEEGLANVKGWTVLGNVTSVIATDIPDSGGVPRTYYITVRAHNTAGLVSAPGLPPTGTLVKGQSSVGMTIPSAIVVAGRPAIFSITAYPGDSTVKVMRRVGAVTSQIGSVRTDASGRATFTEYPQQHASYWAEIAEDDYWLGSSSSPATLHVKWSIGLNPSPWVAGRGANVRFFGFVRPVPGRRYAYLQRYYGKGRWRSVRIALLNSTGNFYKVYYRLPYARGSYYFRLYEPYDEAHFGAYSRTVRVRAR